MFSDKPIHNVYFLSSTLLHLKIILLLFMLWYGKIENNNIIKFVKERLS